jgi:hypothetical protein
MNLSLWNDKYMEEIGWLRILLLNLKEYSYTLTLALL